MPIPWAALVKQLLKVVAPFVIEAAVDAVVRKGTRTPRLPARRVRR